jgi:hypothetical protein
MEARGTARAIAAEAMTVLCMAAVKGAKEEPEKSSDRRSTAPPADGVVSGVLEDVTEAAKSVAGVLKVLDLDGDSGAVTLGWLLPDRLGVVEDVCVALAVLVVEGVDEKLGVCEPLPVPLTVGDGVGVTGGELGVCEGVAVGEPEPLPVPLTVGEGVGVAGGVPDDDGVAMAVCVFVVEREVDTEAVAEGVTEAVHDGVGVTVSVVVVECDTVEEGVGVLDVVGERVRVADRVYGPTTPALLRIL